MSITNISTSNLNNNIYILNDSVLTNTSLQISLNQYLIIPIDYTLTISNNSEIDNYGTIINYGTININAGTALNNKNTGVFLNEFTGIINNYSSNLNVNSGRFINRGNYTNRTITSTFTNNLDGVLKNKNGGIFDNNGILVNLPGGLFENYYNYLRNINNGKVINYGQYIPDVNGLLSSYLSYSLISDGAGHSLGIKYDRGIIYGWGANNFGQLGNGTNTNSSSITAIGKNTYSLHNDDVSFNSITKTRSRIINNFSSGYATYPKKSDDVIDLLVLNENFVNGYWFNGGSRITIYGIQDTWSTTKYNLLYAGFIGGSISIINNNGSVEETRTIQSISSSNTNITDTSYNLLIDVSSSFTTNLRLQSKTLNFKTQNSFPPFNFLYNTKISSYNTPPNTFNTTSYTVPVINSQLYTYHAIPYDDGTYKLRYDNSSNMYVSNNTTPSFTNQYENYFIKDYSYSPLSPKIDLSGIDIIDTSQFFSPSYKLFLRLQLTLDLSSEPEPKKYNYFINADISCNNNDFNTFLSNNSYSIINAVDISIDDGKEYLLFDCGINDYTNGQTIINKLFDLSNTPLKWTIRNLDLSLNNSPLTTINKIESNDNSGKISLYNTSDICFNYKVSNGFNYNLPSIDKTTVTKKNNNELYYYPIQLDPISSIITFNGTFNADFSFNLITGYNKNGGSNRTDLSGTRWIELSSGGNSSFGLRDEGSLYSWGDNSQGHLGIGSLTDTSRNYLTRVNTVPKWKGVASGKNHALALDADNNLYSWGDNTYGQLGLGNNNNIYSPNIIRRSYIKITITNTTEITIPRDVNYINVGIVGETTSTNGNGLGAYVQVFDYPVVQGDKIYFLINSISGGAGGGAGVRGGAGSLVYINNSRSITTNNGRSGLIAVAGGSGGRGGFFDGGSAGEFLKGNDGGRPTGGGFGNSGGGGNYDGAGSGGAGGSFAGTGSDYGAGIGGGSGGGGAETGGGGGGGFGGGGGSYNNGGGGGGGSYISTIYGITTSNATRTVNTTSYIELISIFDNSEITFSDIACGANHSLVIATPERTLYVCGNNDRGQLGIGSTTNQNSFKVTTGTNWIKIAAGFQHSLGLRDNGTLYAWGDNSKGQLGNGSTTQYNSPYPVSGVSNGTIWTDIACGANHCLGIRNDGSLYAWGDNSQGQLNGVIGSSTNATPILVYSTYKWVNVSAGDYHSKGIQTNGQLYTWGDNSQGQLGTGTTTDPYPNQPFSLPLTSFNPLLTLT